MKRNLVNISDHNMGRVRAIQKERKREFGYAPTITWLVNNMLEEVTLRTLSHPLDKCNK